MVISPDSEFFDYLEVGDAARQGDGAGGAGERRGAGQTTEPAPAEDGRAPPADARRGDRHEQDAGGSGVADDGAATEPMLPHAGRSGVGRRDDRDRLIAEICLGGGAWSSAVEGLVIALAPGRHRGPARSVSADAASRRAACAGLAGAGRRRAAA